MTSKDSVREETLAVGSNPLLVLKGGSGKPLLVLHEESAIPAGKGGTRRSARSGPC